MAKMQKFFTFQQRYLIKIYGHKYKMHKRKIYTVHQKLEAIMRVKTVKVYAKVALANELIETKFRLLLQKLTMLIPGVDTRQILVDFSVNISIWCSLTTL